MKYGELIKLFRNRPFFETQDVQILGGVSREQARSILPRWVRKDKLSQLRKGKYMLPELYRKKDASTFYISNYLYRPSYVSLHSALAFYGMIPEAVYTVEAVTPGQTNSWETPEGTFEYRSVKQDRFRGYTRESYSSGNPDPQEPFFIARPEKALLDLFYLQKGQWTKSRVNEMRFQNLNRVNPDRLQEHVDRFNSPKVTKAVKTLFSVHDNNFSTEAPA